MNKKHPFPLLLILLAGVGSLLSGCGVIWTSPPFYPVENKQALPVPVMDMQSYRQIAASHPRPYTYVLRSSAGGSVTVIGTDHVKEPSHSQLDTIAHRWMVVRPTVALVEGRLGFLFSWFQDPVETYGEGGLVAKLAKADGISLYTWEPTRDDEIDLLLRKFPAEQLAMFYTFRPYFSNMRHGKPSDPEDQLQSYLESRTDYDHIRGIYQSWEDLDRVWKRDFPAIDWRTYSDEQGWPAGYLSEIWNQSNLTRDEHLIMVITRLVNSGDTVFVTMGASHAPRIEPALKALIR